MIMNRTISILFVALVFVVGVNAQKFVYDVDFLSYFDNRESGVPYYGSQTLFGMRLSPEVGVDFIDNKGGDHRLMVGASYVQPFGSTWRRAKVMPTAYYRLAQKGFRATMGIIPYRNLVGNIPGFYMSDSLRYATPNLFGAAFSYESKHGYVEAFCDWRALPTESVREAFKVFVGGRYNYKTLFVGGYMQLNHLASRKGHIDGVCDEFVLNPFIGADFTKMTPMDSLSVKVSYLTGLQRHRKIGESIVPHGFIAELYLRWKWIGVSNLFYYGGEQMPFYGELGAQFNQGEPFYGKGVYNKASAFVTIVRRSFVNLTFYYNLHYKQGCELTHQQLLTVNFNLEALMTKKDKDMRNFFTL